MKIIRYFPTNQASAGSALIVVLWSLVLISFLAGQYLDHNRGKACFAENAWSSLKKKEAVDSMLHLFATDSWPIPGEINLTGTWTEFSPGGVDLWVKVDSEADRININSAPDSRIRQKIQELLGEERADEADELANAILDWRDKDTLVRVNDTEEAFYRAQGLAYTPSDGPFNVLNELILVKGMTRDLFWGDPMKDILGQETEEEKSIPFSVLDAFTIYPNETKRVSIVVPGKGNGYIFTVAFLEMKNGQWDVLQIYQTMGIASGNTNSVDQPEQELGLS